MVERARDNPWRQGHLLPIKAVVELGLHDAEGAELCLALVITHDCDLANTTSEPSVEVIVGSQVSELRGEYTNGKNIRKLHLEFQHGKALVPGEFLATAKATVAKSALFGFQPRSDFCLEARQGRILQNWLAARYRRASFADEFERRLADSGLKERLGKILGKSGETIRAIYFDVDNGEVIARKEDDDLYVLDIFILHTTEDPDAAYEAASQVKMHIEQEFERRLYVKGRGWKQIELRDCTVLSDEAMTVKQAQELKQWRMDHVSLRGETPQPIAEN